MADPLPDSSLLEAPTTPPKQPSNGRQYIVSVQSRTSSFELQPLAQAPRLRQKPAATSVSKSLLRSVGLRAIASVKWPRRNTSRIDPERPKVIISTSRLVAISRNAVHLLPVCVTTALIGVNALQRLHGPPVSNGGLFVLQVASKFHELMIVGSLTVVVLDMVRRQLLGKGVNFGLLGSAFSFGGLNFLWSPGFFSVFRRGGHLKPHVLLCLVAVICCVLSALVGPASALLFIPINIWKGYGNTDYYLGGSENLLWPLRLTANHTGPRTCFNVLEPPRAACLWAGYPSFQDRVKGAPYTSFETLFEDARVRRVMYGRRWGDDNPGCGETWVQSSRLDVAVMMNDLLNKQMMARRNATGNDRRLALFGSGFYVITQAPVPVARAVCGPPVIITNDTNTLPFPVLQRDQAWSTRVPVEPNQFRGPLKEREVSHLQRFDVPGPRGRATWVTLDADFGAATAGVAYVSQNSTIAVGRGCTVDARWALGQSVRNAGGFLAAFESHIGEPQPSVPVGYYSTPHHSSFLDSLNTRWYTDVIRADQEWIDALQPVRYITSEAGGYNQTAFSSIVNIPRLNFPPTLVDDTLGALHENSVMVEYISAGFLADALSRVGYSLSADAFSDMLRPELMTGDISNYTKIFTGGPIFDLPTTSSYSTVRVAFYTYGTAWAFGDVGQYLGLSILAVYLLIAVTHAIIVIAWSRSTEAWDSIEELVVLAWNSEPTRREHELASCASGITKVNTLETRVRVVGVQDDPSGKRVELVVVNDKGQNVDDRFTEAVHNEDAYA